MIREATLGDAEAIAALQARAWVRAYSDFLPPEAVEPEAVEARKHAWTRILAEGPAVGAPSYVWDQDGAVAGVISVAAARDEDVRGAAGELLAVYVDPPAQGAGVGRALLDTGEARLREEGYAVAVLWVFAANGLARDVYARRGWVLEPEDVIRRAAANAWAPVVRYRLAL